MLNKLRYLRWYYWGRWWIKNKIDQKASKGEKIKVVIGSGKYYGFENGWIYTDLPHFNILNEPDWKYYFGKSRIDNLLSEHVFEHLTEKETGKVLMLAFQYLKPNGIFRIAVPDGFNSDPDYIENVKPGGIGPGCDDHKILWNYKSLSQISLKAGLEPDLLEYFDQKVKFHIKDYSFEHGFIQRSKKNNFTYEGCSNYTSLIIDLKKSA